MAKPEYDKAMYRLTTMICRLNIGEALDVKELAAEFGVSLRTIQKDLNERLSHLPIERREEDGCYHFIGDYRLRGTSEPDAILVADLITAMIRNVDAGYTRIADNFLKGRSFSTSCFLFHLNLEDISACGALFRLLNQAVALRQQISFSYRNNKGESKEYTVHPYRLANLKGFWYLLAYDLKSGRLKSFYLKKISAPIIHPGNFQIDAEVMAELENFSAVIFSPWVSEDCRTVKLKVGGLARLYLERNLPAALQIDHEHDEALLVSMTYFAEAEVLALVKQWLPDIVILDNQDLAEKLKNELEVYCRQAVSAS
ncbi:MAG: WYL domain-containing protein [Deltaproteobacteria bacterium]|nr:WYL domain-containing protein [Deltaproteobacteria bacterium]